MKVRLNLASNPLHTHRKFLVASGLTGAIAFLVVLGLGWHVYTVRKANATSWKGSSRKSRTPASTIAPRSSIP